MRRRPLQGFRNGAGMAKVSTHAGAPLAERIVCQDSPREASIRPVPPWTLLEPLRNEQLQQLVSVVPVGFHRGLPGDENFLHLVEELLVLFPVSRRGRTESLPSEKPMPMMSLASAASTTLFRILRVEKIFEILHVRRLGPVDPQALQYRRHGGRHRIFRPQACSFSPFRRGGLSVPRLWE